MGKRSEFPTVIGVSWVLMLGAYVGCLFSASFDYRKTLSALLTTMSKNNVRFKQETKVLIWFVRLDNPMLWNVM